MCAGSGEVRLHQGIGKQRAVGCYQSPYVPTAPGERHTSLSIARPLVATQRNETGQFSHISEIKRRRRRTCIAFAAPQTAEILSERDLDFIVAPIPIMSPGGAGSGSEPQGDHIVFPIHEAQRCRARRPLCRAAKDALEDRVGRRRVRRERGPGSVQRKHLRKRTIGSLRVSRRAAGMDEEHLFIGIENLLGVRWKFYQREHFHALKCWPPSWAAL